MRKEADGTLVGVKCTPFNYTGRVIRSMPNYEKDLKDEMNDKFVKGEIPTKTGKDSIWKGGYLGRYPPAKFGDDRWKDEVEKAISNTKCIIKHMIITLLLNLKKYMREYLRRIHSSFTMII